MSNPEAPINTYNHPDESRDSLVNVELRQKISNLELQLADYSSKRNHEVAMLHQKLSKSSASLEKNELTRQKLELQLAQCQKELNQAKRRCLEIEDASKIQIMKLKDEVNNQKNHASHLQSLLEGEKSSKESAVNERVKELFDLKDRIEELNRENQISNQEKQILEHNVQSVKSMLQSSEEKCEVLEGQRKNHTETIEKLVKDVENQSANSDHLQQRNKQFHEKIKMLEEHLEDERAARLQAKISLEAKERQLKDVEKNLEEERLSREEVTKKFEELSQKHSTLEVDHQKIRSSLEQINYGCQLHTEQLREKSHVISEMTRELEKYNEEFNILKKELHEVKSKLETSNKTNSGTVQKIKKALLMFNVNKTDKKEEEIHDELSASELISHVRGLYNEMQERVTGSEAKIAMLKRELESSKTENRDQRKALQEAEKLVVNAQNQMNSYQSKYSSTKEKLLETEEATKQSKLLLEEQLLEYKQLLDKCEEIQEQRAAADQRTVSTLQGIYELLADDQLPELSRQLSFEDLKEAIVGKIRENLHNAGELARRLTEKSHEIQLLTEDLHQHRQGLQKLKSFNSDVLQQTEKSLVEGQKVWAREKDELQQRYESEKLELNKRVKLVNESYESISLENDTLRRDYKDLMISTHQLKKLLHKRDEQFKILSVAIVVVSGGFYGFLYKLSNMIAQQNILVKLLQKTLLLRDSSLEISKLMSKTAIDNKQNSLKGIFRFRVAVIAILASNRFNQLSKSMSFTFRDKDLRKRVIFIGRKDNDEDANKAECLRSWLQSHKFVDDVMNSVKPCVKGICAKELENHLDRPATKDGQLSNLVISTICHCFMDYLGNVKETFLQSACLSCEQDFSRKSLICRLGLGLRRCMTKDICRKPLHYNSTENIISTMRESVLGFTTRLQDAEVEKKSLRAYAERYREERNQIKAELHSERAQIVSVQMAERQHKNKISELENQLERMVSEKQFASVCNDLTAALKREEELEILFQQQAEQIQQVNQRLELHEKSYKSKSTELEDVMKALIDTQNKLKAQEATTKRHQDKVKEYSDLNRESEMMRNYFNIVERNLQRNGRNSGLISVYDGDIPLFTDYLSEAGTQQLSPCMDEIAASVTGILNSLKKAVQQVAVLRAEKQAMRTRMATLEDDIKAHRTHVQRVKQQISAVCQQDVCSENKAPQIAGNHQCDFIPLNAHTGNNGLPTDDLSPF